MCCPCKHVKHTKKTHVSLNKPFAPIEFHIVHGPRFSSLRFTIGPSAFISIFVSIEVFPGPISVRLGVRDGLNELMGNHRDHSVNGRVAVGRGGEVFSGSARLNTSGRVSQPLSRTDDYRISFAKRHGTRSSLCST